ncbi:MAG: hypothetical protein KDA66_19495, partial [Planctomycetaceae bacterium]|nr:hypothetical protein [Planctomycetaceae bacterium]
MLSKMHHWVVAVTFTAFLFAPVVPDVEAACLKIGVHQGDTTFCLCVGDNECSNATADDFDD